MFTDEFLENLKLKEFKVAELDPKEKAAWYGALEKGFVGAEYKPVLVCADQSSRGVNYWFIAEQTSVTAKPERRLVTIGINEFNGNYGVIPTSINTVPFGY